MCRVQESMNEKLEKLKKIIENKKDNNPDLNPEVDQYLNFVLGQKIYPDPNQNGLKIRPDLCTELVS